MAVPVDDLPDSPSGVVPASDLPDTVAPQSSSGASDAVGSELAPYSSGSDVRSSLLGKSSSPTIRAIEAVKGLLELPARTGQTINEGSTQTGVDAGDYLEQKGVPPTLAAYLASLTSMAVNPLNYATMGMDNPSGEIVTPNPQAQQVAQDFSKYGITPTPAQLTQGQLAQRVETLGNRYPYSAQKFQDFYTQQMADLDNVRSSLMSKVGNNEATQAVSDMMKNKISNYLQTATPEDAAVLQDKFGDLDSYMKNEQAGQFGQGMLAAASKLAHEKADAMYSNLPIDPKANIPTPQFSALAKQFLNDELQATPVDRNAQWVKRLASYANVQNVPGLDLSESVTGGEASNLQKAIQEALGEKTAQMPFAGTQMAMKNLRDLRITNDPGYLLGASGQGNRFSGYAAQLRGALSSDIQNGVNTISPDAGNALQQANSTWGQYKQLFNDPYITGLLKSDPEDFITRAIRPNDISNVAMLKNAVGDQNFLPIKQNFLSNMLVDKEGNLSPSGFVNKVNKFGMPTLSTIFDPDELTEITNAQRVFSAMGTAEKATGNTSGTAGILMAKQAILGAPSDALLTLFGGHAGFAAAVTKDIAKTYVMPRLLAKAYLSEPVRDMILHGITAPDSAMMALGTIGKAAMAGANQSLGAMPTQAQPQGQTQ